MALYDHRVFRADGQWWVAQVHSGAGAGTTGGSEVTTERVFFTCISDKVVTGRTNRIPAGTLNRLSHRSIVERLRSGEEMQHGLRMHPYNAPPAEEFRDTPAFTDREGLRWVVRRSELVQHQDVGVSARPAVELICLDDSALRQTVLLEESHTYDDAERFAPADINEALIAAVKGRYEDLGDNPPDFW